MNTVLKGKEMEERGREEEKRERRRREAPSSCGIWPEGLFDKNGLE